MVNRGKEIPTVSSLGHLEPYGRRGAFYGHHGCVFWRLLILPSTAKVITLRTKTQLAHQICFEITSRLGMPSMMWWIWPISTRLASLHEHWRWTEWACHRMYWTTRAAAPRQRKTSPLFTATTHPRINQKWAVALCIRFPDTEKSTLYCLQGTIKVV